MILLFAGVFFSIAVIISDEEGNQNRGD